MEWNAVAENYISPVLQSVAMQCNKEARDNIILQSPMEGRMTSEHSLDAIAILKCQQDGRNSEMQNYIFTRLMHVQTNC